MMLQCNKCGELLESSEFYHYTYDKNKLRKTCKECMKKEDKENRKRRKPLARVKYDRLEIKRMREKKGISLFDACIRLGINYHTYAAIENKGRVIDKKRLEHIKEFYSA